MSSDKPGKPGPKPSGKPRRRSHAFSFEAEVLAWIAANIEAGQWSTFVNDAVKKKIEETEAAKQKSD